MLLPLITSCRFTHKPIFTLKNNTLINLDSLALMPFPIFLPQLVACLYFSIINYLTVWYETWIEKVFWIFDISKINKNLII